MTCDHSHLTWSECALKLDLSWLFMRCSACAHNHRVVELDNLVVQVAAIFYIYYQRILSIVGEWE